MNNLVKISQAILPALFNSIATETMAGSKSDLAKEKRWAEQIVSDIMVGKDMTLQADGVEFIVLFTEATTEKAKAAVILIHGMEFILHGLMSLNPCV